MIHNSKQSSHVNDLRELNDFCHLKFELLSKGAKLGPNILKDGENIKGPMNLRSGLSSGIDIILPNEIWVNVPVKESFVRDSKFILDFEEDRHILRTKTRNVAISIPPQPFYYSQKASDGTPLKYIGTIRGDRLSIGIDKTCTFWSDDRLKCKFCAIGATSKEEPQKKTLDKIFEVVNAALNDSILAAKHIYLNCGNQSGTDNGIKRFSKIVEQIKRKFDVHVHLNPCPPHDKAFIYQLFDSGLDELSFNIDIFDAETAATVIPAKYKMRKRYFEGLEYAAKVFGKNRVSSCLVVGLEPIKGTLEGIDFLCSMGVVPKLSCFRPLRGSLLESSRPPSYDFLVDLYFKAKDIVDRWGIPLGPLCAACQLHSIVCYCDSRYNAS